MQKNCRSIVWKGRKVFLQLIVSYMKSNQFQTIYLDQNLEVKRFYKQNQYQQFFSIL